MDNYTAIALAEGFEQGTEEQIIEAWQHLENTGLAYKLQEFFGRTCQSLIERGIITARNTQTQTQSESIDKDRDGAIGMCAELGIL